MEPTSAMSIGLIILTASRSGEVLNVNRDEFDLEKAHWTVLAFRMKAGHEHRISAAQRHEIEPGATLAEIVERCAPGWLQKLGEVAIDGEVIPPEQWVAVQTVMGDKYLTIDFRSSAVFVDVGGRFGNPKRGLVNNSVEDVMAMKNALAGAVVLLTMAASTTTAATLDFSSDQGFNGNPLVLSNATITNLSGGTVLVGPTAASEVDGFCFLSALGNCESDGEIAFAGAVTGLTFDSDGFDTGDSVSISAYLGATFLGSINITGNG